MSENPMDTETALATIVDRIKSTDLKETYFIARDAVEGASVSDDAYTVDILEDTVDSLRVALVDVLHWSEIELDELYAEWVAARKLD